MALLLEMQQSANAAATQRVADDQEPQSDDGNNPKDVNGDSQTEEDGNQEENENDWKHVFFPIVVAMTSRDGQLISRGLYQAADRRVSTDPRSGLHEAPPDDPRTLLEPEGNGVVN